MPSFLLQDSTLPTLFIVFLLLITGRLLNKYLPWLQKWAFPSAMTGGFLGMIAFNLPFASDYPDRDFCGFIVYHTMALGFIILALASVTKPVGRKVLATGLAPVMSLVFQTLLGFLLGLLSLRLFFPDIYLGFGLLFPLGFSQGPGQAFTIGSQWESLGFPNAATSGLAFATWGMLWGTIPGVFLINVLRKIYKTAPLKQLNKKTTTQQPPETIGPGSLLKLLLHTSGIYMITLLLISLLAFSLSLSGNIGASFAGIIWGLHFLFAVCLAFLFRFTWHRFSPASWHYSSKERYFLGHAGSLSLDIMVVAAIASINLQQLSTTFAPVFLISTIGGFIVLLYSVYLGRQIFREHQVENTVALYGLFTGTMASSSALLRAIDPEDTSGTMSNLAMASGICVLPSLPVIFIANLPIIAISQEISWLLPLSLVLLAVYYCILHFCLQGILRKMN